MQLRKLAEAATWRRTLGLIAVLAAALFAEDYVRGPGEPDIERLEGRPRLIDGDSLALAGETVRMVGIDAPEGRQMCQRDGRDWPCGRESTAALRKLIAGRPVVCQFEGRDKHRRLLGTCHVGGKNLNQSMVERGYAVSFGRRYLRQERTAKSEKRGMWSGTFERPRDWRRRNLGSVLDS